MSETLRRSKLPGRREAEASYTAASALIPLIVRNARDLIAFLDVEGRRIYNSPSYAPLLGDPDALVGTDSFADVHADDRERVRAVFRDTVRSGSGYRVEYRLVVRDGSARVVQSEGSVIRADDGNVVGVVVVGRDVTQERHAESQLDAALRRQTALAEFSLYALRASDPAHVLERAVRLTAEALSADFCTVLELQPDGRTLRVAAGHNWPQHRLGRSLSAGEGAQSIEALELYAQADAQSLEAPQPVVLADVRHDERHKNTFRVRELGVVSSASVVIPAPGHPYGTLVAHSRTPRQFEAAECEFVQAVANVLSAALMQFTAQGALRRQTEQLTIAQRGARMIVLDWDIQIDELEFSDSPAWLRGPVPKDTGKYPLFKDQVHPEDRTYFLAARQRAVETLEPETLEFRVIRTDGDVVWVRSHQTTIADADGKAVRMIAALYDITEHKAAQQALRESEARFRSLTEFSSDWYWEQDGRFRFTLIAGPRASENASSGDASVYLGKARWEIADLEPVEGDWALHRARLERHEPLRDVHFRRRMSDGTIRYMSVSGEPVLGEDGCFSGYRGVGSNITERKIAEQALADSEARFRSLTALSSDWYWEQDAELRFSAISAGFFRKSGMLLEELLGKHRWDLSGALPPGGSWDAHRAVLEARRPFRDFEFMRVAADGTAHYQSISGEPVFDADGRFTGYRGTGRDLTERRRAERELRARVEGDRALIELGLIGLREQNAAVLLQHMVEIVARTLEVDLAGVAELQPDDAALKLVAGIGWKPGLVGQATVGAELESQAGFALHQYQRAKQSGSERFAPVIVADLSSERRFRVPAVMREHGAVSGMSVVVPGAERPWGVLGVHSRTPRRFEPREAEFLQAAANVLSAALARCAAHAASQDSERRYRILFEASPEPMFVFDRESLAILAVNRRMIEQYGWSREELLAMSILELRPPEERAQIVEDVRTTPGTRGWKRRRYWRKGGDVLDVEVTARVVYYGGRSAEMVIAVDISQRLRMEQALREHRRLLARAQELAGLGYWQYDATSGVSGSRELRRMLGIERDLPAQSPDWCLNLVHPEDRERVRDAVLESFEKASSYELEARVLTAGGTQRILLLAGEALKDDAGRVTKVIGSCLDVTEQRERENALCEAADQLQALSRRLVDAQETERRRLATELHDRVGQNLTALGINLDILARRMSGLDDDARRRLEESHSLIVATTRCVAGVLDDLHPPMLDDLGLGPTLRWAAQDFSRRTEIPTKVRVDGVERRIDRQNELALLRIVQEALTNVTRHAGACAVGITLVWHPEALQVEVADDGAGFDCGGPRGLTGLGIATMRERSLAVHGQLDIDSAPGQGTRVRVVVPG